MTARSRAFDTPGPMVRGRVVASIVRKDMALLGPYALACSIWMFALAALIRTDRDVSSLMAGVGVSGSGLDAYLFAMFVLGLPVALVLFVILLAQTNVASDTRHDWLIRPVAPLELVASKLATVLGVIVAPMIAGSFVYMIVKAAPPEEAFMFFLPTLICVPLLVLSWLVATPFRALLALLGVFVLLAVAAALAGAMKVAVGIALAADPTPFPGLDDNWIVALVAGIGLYVASGVALWLLLARRKRAMARRVFVGYLAASVFLQSLLFSPMDKTEAAAAEPAAAGQSFAASVDAPGFLAAASALLDETPHGDVALVLIDHGEVVGGHYASVGKPVGPQTLFQVASLSKWITAWGVMALVEEGRIDLDAPVSTYLTRWRLPKGKFDNDGVTVRRLLSHSAGLDDGFGYAGFEHAEDVQTLEESLSRTADGASNLRLPGFLRRGVRVGLEPGAQWRYSGGGYTILQLVIEEVSGRSFNDYMRERVLLPLGMSGSTFVLDEAGEARRADFYADDGSIAPHYHYTALAAASLYTSTEDMTRFLLAHLPGPDGAPPGRGVLRPETLEAMREPQIAVQPPAAWWGLGVALTPGARGGWAMSHSGGNRPAIRTVAQIDPGSGDGIVMLSSGEPDGMRVVQEWWAWEVRRGAVTPPAAAPGSAPRT